MQRRFGVAMAVLLLAGCSGASEDGNQERSSGPNVAVTAAPGVAFRYQYSFSLPAQRIAAAQERHAAACERLGVARCRITALRFSQPDNERFVNGTLALALAPALARAFGRDGIKAVEEAGGRLLVAEIEGTDTNPATRAADRTAASVGQELGQTEGTLASGRGSAAERAERVAQQAQLRAELREAAAAKAEQRQLLAVTPVTFSYQSGDATGIAQIGEALRNGGGNILSGIATILYLLVTLLPWAIALGLLALAWRFVRRRLFPREGI